MLRICVLSLLISLSLAQWGGFLGNFFNNCRRSENDNCDRHSEHLECGSDGVTYRNRCEFTKAHCKDDSIDVMYYHACDNRTVTGGPVLSGSEAVLDYFCLELAHEDCPVEKEILCGTDRVTYENLCEYEKAKCTHRDLEVITFGQCPNVVPQS